MGATPPMAPPPSCLSSSDGSRVLAAWPDSGAEGLPQCILDMCVCRHFLPVCVSLEYECGVGCRVGVRKKLRGRRREGTAALRRSPGKHLFRERTPLDDLAPESSRPCSVQVVKQVAQPPSPSVWAPLRRRGAPAAPRAALVSRNERKRTPTAEPCWRPRKARIGFRGGLGASRALRAGYGAQETARATHRGSGRPRALHALLSVRHA